MFDIGWPELLVVVILLLVVVGPKDLPVVLRTVGRYVGKVRAIGREFTNTLEEVAKEAELDGVVESAKRVQQPNVKAELEKFLSGDEPDPKAAQSQPKAVEETALKAVGSVEETSGTTDGDKALGKTE